MTEPLLAKADADEFFDVDNDAEKNVIEEEPEDDDGEDFIEVFGRNRAGRPSSRDAHPREPESENKIPSWATDFQIAQIRDDYEKDKQRKTDTQKIIHLDRVCGPAVQWGLACLFSTFFFFSSLPVAALFSAECPDNEYEFAKYAEGPLWVIFFTPAAALVVIMQWKVMTYMVTPMRSYLKAWGKTEMDKDLDYLGLISFGRIMNKKKAFYLWFAVMTVFTMFNLLDSMTNAMVTSKLYATKSCKSYIHIQEVWYNTMKDSIWEQNRFFDLDFADLVLFFYFVQCIVQPMFVFYNVVAVQRWGWRNKLIWLDSSVTYNIIKVSSLAEEKTLVPVQYKTMYDSQGDDADFTTHYTAMILIAEYNRMELITSQDAKYRRLKTTNCIGINGSVMEKKMHAYLEYAQGAYSRGVQRFILKGFVQNALQVNLQISMISISKAMSFHDPNEDGQPKIMFGMFTFPARIDPAFALSVGVSIFGMFFDVPDMIDTLRFCRQIFRKLNKAQSQIRRTRENAVQVEGQQRQTQKCCFFWEEDGLDEGMRMLRNRLILLFGSFIVYLVFSFYLLFKLYAAVYVCEIGMWNVRLNIGEGCVPRSTLTQYTWKQGAINYTSTCKIKDVSCSWPHFFDPTQWK